MLEFQLIRKFKGILLKTQSQLKTTELKEKV